NKLGEEFDGVISGVTHFGIFIELASGAEGLIHIRNLPGYYEYDEAHYTLAERPGRFGAKNQGCRFRIGDSVRVQLVKVSEEKRQVDFRLAEESLPLHDEEPLPTPILKKKARSAAARPRKAQRPQPRSR
ncbi:MAG TPA: S1 RNA-binding domain-containing protein, partial [Candidatus Kapabacteria bacterium]|nr:S1 RNA-binding domain-containing protein [Candidatus Kapabacteria bacterium]